MLNAEKMLKDKCVKLLKATVKLVIVAFIYSIIIMFFVYRVFNKDVKTIVSYIDLISSRTSESILSDTVLDTETNNLTNYPEYGTVYGNLIISSIGVDAKIYFGDSLSILKYGIGHTTGSYFPGEGGTIIYMGHNNTYLKTLEKIELGDTIVVETTYGIFLYEVYDTKTIYKTDTDELPIQRDEEILMLYSCHKVTAFGHSPYRFVVYAKRVGDSDD